MARDIKRHGQETKQNHKNIQQQKIIEFGGTFGTLFFMFALPIGTISLYMFCNESQCSFFKLPNFKDLKKNFFNLTVFYIYIVFLFVLALPFGRNNIKRLTNLNATFVYSTNGVFSCTIVFTICLCLELFQLSIFSFIYDHYFHFLNSAIILGFVLSLYVYIKSFFIPKNALNTHALDRAVYAFFMGREINPRLFGVLDLKMFVLQSSLITSLILNTAVLYQCFVTKNTTDFGIFHICPTLLVIYIIQAVYLIDPIVHESVWLTSFEVRYEGFGYMSGMGYLVYPFMISSITKYVNDYKVQLPNWLLATVVILFLFGYTLFRGSNNQKDKFRRDPNNPDNACLKTIPTDQGKKLLVSGYWGIVRHPNYLGDIIMNLSWCPFVFFVPPVLTILSIILLLVHRAARDNERCKLRYGSSWDKYCQKVKYVLIPKVY